MTQHSAITRERIPKPVDRDEWLAVRRPYFNASAAAVLFDRHPFQTPGDYAATKLSGIEASQNRAMRRGVALEEPVVQMWAEDHGVTVYEPDELFVADRMMATVDRFIVQTDRPVEVKTTGLRVDEPERYWLDQCQAVMHCAGADVMELVWMDASMDVQSVTVDADPQLQVELADRAERFMAAIDLGMVPDWVQMSSSNLATIYPNPQGEVEVGEDVVSALRRYLNLRDQRSEVEADMATAKDEVAAALGDHEVAVFDGRQVATWKATAGYWKLDAARVKREAPDVFDRFKVWVEGTRRFNPTL